jgi:hypothetical protein
MASLGARSTETIEPIIKIIPFDLHALAAIKFVDPDLNRRAQPLDPGPMRVFLRLKQTQTRPHHLAGVLVGAGFDTILDKLVEHRGQADIACGHAINLAR